MNPETISAVQAFAAVTFILMVAALGVVGLRWAWNHTGRPSLPESDAATRLEGALARLDENEQRIAELEERVDFAERLLAQQAEALKLEAPKR
jgi:hypothetical protein